MKFPTAVLAVLATLSALPLPAQDVVSAPDPVPKSNGEYVILVGGVSLMAWEKFKAQPHDNWWMNFVRAARIRTQQVQAVRPDLPITWLVYRPSYLARAKVDKNDLIGNINSVRDAFNIKLIYFDKTQEVFDYLNAGQPRDSVKLVGFEFFGHSNKACWMFDYSSNMDSASKCWLHESELGRIKRGIFARDAFIKSWGCHTGESMNKKFYGAVGVRMWGATGKTQYQTEALPILSSSTGRWTR